MCGTLDCLIDELYEFFIKYVKCENVLYTVQFLLCSHKLSNLERQKIVRKHKSSEHKSTMLGKRGSNHANLERKRSKENYKLMDFSKKKLLLNNKAEKYKSMDNIRKKPLLEANAKKYSSMDPSKKKRL